jgi:hypothetical protein
MTAMVISHLVFLYLSNPQPIMNQLLWNKKGRDLSSRNFLCEFQLKGGQEEVVQEEYRNLFLSIPELISENYPWKVECFLEDLFLGGQSSIILGYRRLSVKSLHGLLSF